MKQENFERRSPFLRNFSEEFLKSMRKQNLTKILRDKFLTEWGHKIRLYLK